MTDDGMKVLPELPMPMVESLRTLVEMLEADGRWPVNASEARTHLEAYDRTRLVRDVDPKVLARVKEGLSGNADLCPACGADMGIDVSYDTEDHIGGGLIAQPGRCPDCLASWSDMYELHDVALDIIPPGVWTPWGDALCQECHDDREDIRSKPGWKAVSWQACDSTDIGYCSFCGEKCRLPHDVAILTRVQDPLVEGDLALEQTGGMCAGLFNRAPDGGRVIVVTVEQDILVGVYESEVAWQAGQPASLTTYTHHRQARKAVRELLHPSTTGAAL